MTHPDAGALLKLDEEEKELFAQVTKNDLAGAVTHLRSWMQHIDNHNRNKYADLLEAQGKLIAHFVTRQAASQGSAGGEADSAFPLKYIDGPDYCTVETANGANFAMTLKPDLMKAMERAICRDIAALSRPVPTGGAETDFFRCNCPHEVRSGCSEPKCPHYVKPRPVDAVALHAETATRSAVQSEVVTTINARLTDLAEANALYGKDQHLGAPDKIARNEREILWLKDLRSMIALGVAQAAKEPVAVKHSSADIARMIDAGIEAVNLYQIAKDDVITRKNLRGFLQAALSVPSADRGGK